MRRSKRHRKVWRVSKPNPPLQKRISEDRADRIGSGVHRDFITKSSYPWASLAPLSEYNIESAVRNGNIPKLKRLCADNLARSVEQLEREYLEFAPWSCWSMVWDSVLRRCNDSFRAHQVFSSKFGGLRAFRAHIGGSRSACVRPLRELSSPQRVQHFRNKTIKVLSPPGARNYRIENVFANISITNLVSRLSEPSNRPMVVLDVSRAVSAIAKDDYYMLINIPKLVALDLSASQVIDDSFIGNLGSSVSLDGKLAKLSVLRVRGCRNITSRAVHDLLLRCNEMYSSLTYLETDLALPTVKHEASGKRYVRGTKWHLVNDNQTSIQILEKLPLGLKLHSLHRILNGMAAVTPMNQEPVVDIMMFPQSYSAQEDLERRLELLEACWTTRLNSRHGESSSYAYVIDVDHEVQPNSQASDASTTLQKKPSKSKPRILKTNASKFFNV